MVTNFFNYTQDWVNGELLEGIIVTVFGIFTVLLGIALWHYAKSPAARALIFPIITCGIIYMSIGGGLCLNNRGLIEKFHTEYRANPKEFLIKEKQRVEDFQYMYKISKTVATIAFITTLLIFWLSKSPIWQGIGIGVALFGLAGLIVDFFSQHRAMEYYDAIITALNI